ncbi:hypothetical protein B0T16DRAFT_451130 [Cercophora newfieldiana]|uniref:Uncharacterized protein n=1 Tax=Cercophora newfieldiana TaxID=92897 RepID=A0AA39YPN7_9PEZI|nr:hypothetical protein B0T16DRAFT_451130 [Cercophora newfieldiana]
MGTVPAVNLYDNGYSARSRSPAVVRRRIFTRFSDQTLELEATADGEVVLLRRNQTGRFDHGEALVLLEGKRRFTLVHEGRPVIPDEELGQMVGEALALRLSQRLWIGNCSLSVTPPVFGDMYSRCLERLSSLHHFCANDRLRAALRSAFPGLTLPKG